MQGHKKPADEQRPNTLGLREIDLKRVLDALDQSRKGENAGRTFARWQYHQTSVPVRIIHPSGNEVEVKMACRNLSKGGIGFLHRSFLHLGTRCIVTLDHPIRGDVQAPGRVVRCLHLTGMVHEIGIKFDEEIDVRDIMRPDPMQEMLAIESIDAGSLIGTVMLVNDSEMDARLVRHFLRNTQLRIKHVTSTAEAEKEARDGVGLIISEIHLGFDNGGEFAKRLHEFNAPTPPVVLTSADTSETTHTLVAHPGVAGFISKPFTQENLIRTVAEFLVDPNEAGAMSGKDTFVIDPQLRAALIPELAGVVERLDKVFAAEDATGVLAILMQLKGVAPVLGLSDLSMLLETMTFQLSMSSDLDLVRSEIADVTRICLAYVDRG